MREDQRDLRRGEDQRVLRRGEDQRDLRREDALLLMRDLISIRLAPLSLSSVHVCSVHTRAGPGFGGGKGWMAADTLNTRVHNLL